MLAPHHYLINGKKVVNHYHIHLDKLNDILDKNEKVGVMKLDVEGHEWCAINGAEQVISRT